MLNDSEIEFTHVSFHLFKAFGPFVVYVVIHVCIDVILEIEYSQYWNKDSDFFLLKKSQMASVEY